MSHPISSSFTEPTIVSCCGDGDGGDGGGGEGDGDGEVGPEN